MGKMFTYNGKMMKTWNIFSGCKFECCYCWAKPLILNRMKDTPKYRECKFVPTFHGKELTKTFKPDDFVFVAPLGDISFASLECIEYINERINKFPKTKFLFCTKNPAVYRHFIKLDNVYYGTTIETNRDVSKFSKAPSERWRFETLLEVNGKRFISIEPVMDFELGILITWIEKLKPEIVEIGGDNYGHNLPEPSSNKIKELISCMETLGITVVRKEGLERLLK